MSKLRWAKFFWADWDNDTALASCSMAAQGLWMRLLCVAAQGDPYGTITVKGSVPDEATLRHLCRLPPTSNSARDFRRWMAELRDREVLTEVWIVPSGSSPALPRFVPAASRLLHDGFIAMKRSAASRQRWKLAEDQDRYANLHMQKPGNGADLHIQTSRFCIDRSRSRVDAKKARDSAGSAPAVSNPETAEQPARADTHPNPPSSRGRASDTEATHPPQPPAGLRPTAATRGSLNGRPASAGATPGRPFRIIDGRR